MPRCPWSSYLCHWRLNVCYGGGELKGNLPAREGSNKVHHGLEWKKTREEPVNAGFAPGKRWQSLRTSQWKRNSPSHIAPCWNHNYRQDQFKLLAITKMFKNQKRISKPNAGVSVTEQGTCRDWLPPDRALSTLVFLQSSPPRHQASALACLTIKDILIFL